MTTARWQPRAPRPVLPARLVIARAGRPGLNAAGSGGTREAAERLFAVTGDLIGQGQQAGTLPRGDPYRLQLLFGATLQGIAALVSSGRIPPGQADALITDAITLFSRGQPTAQP